MRWRCFVYSTSCCTLFESTFEPPSEIYCVKLSWSNSYVCCRCDTRRMSPTLAIVSLSRNLSWPVRGMGKAVLPPIKPTLKFHNNHTKKPPHSSLSSDLFFCHCPRFTARTYNPNLHNGRRGRAPQGREARSGEEEGISFLQIPIVPKTP
jgi:hypothetical protein